jgi:hypothetical protein
MATPILNKFGRLYERGKAISKDLKTSIIQVLWNKEVTSRQVISLEV